MAIDADEHIARYSSAGHRISVWIGAGLANVIGLMIFLGWLAPLHLVAGSLINLSCLAGVMIWRYQPLFDIYIDHSLLVLDEPVILGSYRLNDLFGKFDQQIMKSIHQKIFSHSLTEFNQYLKGFLDSDYDQDAKRNCVELTMTLARAVFDPSMHVESIYAMKEWMDEHPLKSETKA